MDSLRQISRFVGMEHVGDMRGVPNFVPVLSGSERTSMRTMIRALQSLPAITLEIDASNTTGQVPLLTTITIHPSPGVIHSTTGIVTKNGQVVGGPSTEPNVLTTASFDATVPGQYVFTISRVGVPSTGITTLQKDVVINAQPHVIPPPPPTPPHISVSSSGSGASAVFTVTGSGFLAQSNVRIHIVRVADGQILQSDVNQSSDAQGKLNARIPLPCQTGLLFHFSATDGRANPSDLTGVLFSNTFDITCP